MKKYGWQAVSVGLLSLLALGVRAEVRIENAWVRAMPPSQHNTAAYLTVLNEGRDSVLLIGVSSTPAAKVQVHNSVEIDGMVRMEHLESVPLAAGETLEFSPGGMHLMIMGLEAMPDAGESFRLCLEFEGSAPSCTQAEVRRAAPSDNEHHQHH